MTDSAPTAQDVATTGNHTPGPWHSTQELDEGRFYILTEDGSYIANVDMAGLDPRCESDARLIAAAPDLLAALEGLLNVTNSLEVLGEWSALDINHKHARLERLKVDAALITARKAIREANGLSQ